MNRDEHSFSAEPGNNLRDSYIRLSFSSISDPRICVTASRKRSIERGQSTRKPRNIILWERFGAEGARMSWNRSPNRVRQNRPLPSKKSPDETQLSSRICSRKNKSAKHPGDVPMEP